MNIMYMRCQSNVLNTYKRVNHNNSSRAGTDLVVNRKTIMDAVIRKIAQLEGIGEHSKPGSRVDKAVRERERESRDNASDQISHEHHMK